MTGRGRARHRKAILCLAQASSALAILPLMTLGACEEADRPDGVPLRGFAGDQGWSNTAAGPGARSHREPRSDPPPAASIAAPGRRETAHEDASHEAKSRGSEPVLMSPPAQPGRRTEPQAGKASPIQMNEPRRSAAEPGARLLPLSFGSESTTLVSTMGLDQARKIIQDDISLPVFAGGPAIRPAGGEGVVAGLSSLPERPAGESTTSAIVPPIGEPPALAEVQREGPPEVLARSSPAPDQTAANTRFSALSTGPAPSRPPPVQSVARKRAAAESPADPPPSIDGALATQAPARAHAVAGLSAARKVPPRRDEITDTTHPDRNPADPDESDRPARRGGTASSLAATLAPRRSTPETGVNIAQITDGARSAYIAQLDLDHASTRLAVRQGKAIIGAVQIQMSDSRISVHMGQVLDMFETRMDKAQFAALRASRAAEQFVSLERLRAAGVPLTYSAAYDELVLAAGPG